MEKSIIILKMYDRLLVGDELTLEYCCEEFEISNATFHRYIALLRYYFTVMHGKELVFSREKNTYLLKE